jgi:hypothetical protein
VASQGCVFSRSTQGTGSHAASQRWTASQNGLLLNTSLKFSLLLLGNDSLEWRTTAAFWRLRVAMGRPDAVAIVNTSTALKAFDLFLKLSVGLFLVVELCIELIEISFVQVLFRGKSLLGFRDLLLERLNDLARLAAAVALSDHLLEDESAGSLERVHLA